VSGVVAAGLPQSPVLLLAAFLLIIACLGGVMVALFDYAPAVATPRRLLIPLVERERDIAAGLGWKPRAWLAARIGFTVLGCAGGFSTGILLMGPAGAFGGFVGFRWALAGRAAKRTLIMERSFLQQLRNLRDRMALSNQSLDTALQEVGRNAPGELRYILAPLARGGSVAANIVDAGVRSRSAVVEYACGVLLWARTRSLDGLIEAIDTVLLEVGEAQLAVQEEALTTLTQQRAVTMAMTALMGVMFFAVIRVPLFRDYYQTLTGQLVLLFVMAVFAGLVGLLSILVRVSGWTRWDLQKLAEQQDRLGV
jgi:hypothetical protein